MLCEIVAHRGIFISSFLSSDGVVGMTRVSVGVVLGVAVSSDFELIITARNKSLFGRIEDWSVLDESSRSSEHPQY